MTDELLTEDQEAERAKQWLRENIIYIAAGVLFGLGGLFGWQAWKDYQAKESGAASVVLQQMRDAIVGERFNEVDEKLAQLESEYSRTPYLDQARLAMARMYMDRNEPGQAMAQLALLEKQGRDPLLREVAELRRAQILVSEGQYDEALELLTKETGSGMLALQHELRGDALSAKGDFAAARDAYEAALNADVGNVIDRNFVQMKIDDVSASVNADQMNAAGDLPELPAAEAAE